MSVKAGTKGSSLGGAEAYVNKPLIAADWKRCQTPREFLQFLQILLPMVKHHRREQIVLFPTMSSLT